VTAFLPGQADAQHGIHLLQPRHQNWSCGVDHHHGTPSGSRDRANKIILAARQCQRPLIDRLGLLLGRQTDNHNRRLRIARCPLGLRNQLLIRDRDGLDYQSCQGDPLGDHQPGNQDPARRRLDHMSPARRHHEANFPGVARQQGGGKGIRLVAVAQRPLADPAYADQHLRAGSGHQLCGQLKDACSLMRSTRQAEQKLGHFTIGGGLFGAGAVEAGNPHARPTGLRIDDRFRRSGSRVVAYRNAIQRPYSTLAECFR
jgi:hypothetical protein